MKNTQFSLAVSFGLVCAVAAVMAQAPAQTPAPASPPAAPAQPPRPTPPTRNPHTPGYVTAKELPDGAVPPVDVEGNFIIGPTHNPAPESVVHEGVPQGTVSNFTMS